jgi:hypothetical protein
MVNIIAHNSAAGNTIMTDSKRLPSGLYPCKNKKKEGQHWGTK